MWMLQKISHLALEWECREASEGKSRKERKEKLPGLWGGGRSSGRKGRVGARQQGWGGMGAGRTGFQAELHEEGASEGVDPGKEPVHRDMSLKLASLLPES